MQIEDILLVNFRNFNNEKAFLKPGLNLIIGPNGSGKTNFLEALNFAYKGVGFARPIDVLMKDKEKGGIKADFKEGFRDLKKIVYVEKKGFKREINNKMVNRINEFRTHNVINFSPYDTFLIDGSPEYRRRFLDELISTVSFSYEKNLRDFFLAQRYRNNYLKNYEHPFSVLDSIDDTFVDLNLRIDAERKRFLELIKKRTKRHLYEISNDWNVDFKIVNSWDTEHPYKFKEKKKKEDAIRQHTTWGIGKDDLLVLFNGNEAKTNASRGQKRAIVISLKLASLDIYKNLSNLETILILDDLLYEFDSKRNEKLAQKIMGFSAFLTSTKRIEANNTILVENGKIKNLD